MSRTDRHRPSWVQASEHGTAEDHRHELLGELKLHRRKKRDKRGRVIMVSQPARIFLRDAVLVQAPFLSKPSVEATYRAVRTEARRRLAAGEWLYDTIDTPEMKDQPVYEEIILGRYADYCTIDEPHDRDERIAGHHDLFAPCTRYLDAEDSGPAYGRGRGERRAGIHRDWRKPSRRTTRTTIRRLTQLADSGADLDEDASDALAR